MTDIHASPPPFEFDFLLSPKPNSKDEMSTDQGSIKIEEVREKEKAQGESEAGEDVTMTTGMSPPSSHLLVMALLFALTQTMGYWLETCQTVTGLMTDSNTIQHLNLNDSSIRAHPTTGQVDMFSQGMYSPYQMTGQYPTTHNSSTPIHQYHFHPYNSNPRDCKSSLLLAAPFLLLPSASALAALFLRCPISSLRSDR